LVQPVEAPVDLTEAGEHFAKSVIEGLFERVEAPVNGVEPPVDGIEPPIDRRELATQELHELLVLGSLTSTASAGPVQVATTRFT
jgi:hypothetical protein